MDFPDTDVRTAIYNLIIANIAWPVYEMRVPKDVTPDPNQYILLTTQTNKQHSTSKCGHLWSTTILIDIVNQQTQGFSSKKTVEQIANELNNLIDINPGDITIPGWTIYNTQMIDSHDMDLDTNTKTINRKLIRYQYILGVAA